MAQESRTEQGLVRRIGVAGVVAAVLVGVAVSLPTGGGGITSLAAAVEQQKSAQGVPHDDAYLPPHDHNDPATKNDVARGLAVGEEAVDPTTAAERSASEAYVEEQRALENRLSKRAARYSYFKA